LDNIQPISWEGKSLKLLDQRILPEREEYVSCNSVEEVALAIRQMVVRGAPAIGVTAAYGMVLAAKATVEKLRVEQNFEVSYSKMHADLHKAGEFLKNSRPTAVNLSWAVEKMMGRVDDGGVMHPKEIFISLEEAAGNMLQEDIFINKKIGDFGAQLLPQKGVVLTHCNAGALATAGYGTALGVIRSAVSSGKSIHVFADETRPFFQGSRLTAWELQKDDIPVTIIVDSGAGFFLRNGLINCVVVGADRVAANGDVANKIGTYPLAVLCRENNVPFYVAVPTSTFDFSKQTGDEIEVEERAADEITAWKQIPIAPVGVTARNPAFDITPAHLVSALITEYGLVTAPDKEKLNKLVQEKRVG